MARNKLSETKIKTISKPGIYGDGDGLYLRAQKGGSKNWVFIWRRGDERNEVGLGGYGQGTARSTWRWRARRPTRFVCNLLAAKILVPIVDHCR